MGAFSSLAVMAASGKERSIGRSAKGGDGYPPYNVERFVPPSEDGRVLRIVLAVAGFAPEDLEVTVSDNQLVIRGQQAEEPSRTYLHRGIAARRFRRSFVLGDGLEVVAADLRNGLLAVDLAGKRPGEVERIAINGSAEPDPDGKE